MLSHCSPGAILDAVADGLEETLLPGLEQPDLRRQCRAAAFLLRTVSAALPELPVVLARNAVASALAVAGAAPDGDAPPAEAVDLDRLAARNAELNAVLADQLDGLDGLDGPDGAALRRVVRENLDRWIAVQPLPPELGGFEPLGVWPLDPPR